MTDARTSLPDSVITWTQDLLSGKLVAPLKDKFDELHLTFLEKDDARRGARTGLAGFAKADYVLALLEHKATVLQQQQLQQQQQAGGGGGGGGDNVNLEDEDAFAEDNFFEPTTFDKFHFVNYLGHASDPLLKCIVVDFRDDGTLRRYTIRPVMSNNIIRDVPRARLADPNGPFAVIHEALEVNPLDCGDVVQLQSDMGPDRPIFAIVEKIGHTFRIIADTDGTSSTLPRTALVRFDPNPRPAQRQRVGGGSTRWTRLTSGPPTPP
jgi:hypothetical protein